MHVVIAVLNNDVNDLHDRKLDFFKNGGSVAEDVAKVRHEYHKAKRRTKLFQVENALNGKSENVFMSKGFNVSNVQAMSNIQTQRKGASLAKETGDRSVEKLMVSLAQKS